MARQQFHRGIMRRTNPARREPGLLDPVLDPVVSVVTNKVVKPVANKVVAPVVTDVVEPIVSSVVAPLVTPLAQAQPTPPPPPATTPSGGSSGGNSNGGGNSGSGGNGGGSGNGNGNGNGNNGNGNNGNGNNGNGNNGSGNGNTGSGNGNNGGGGGGNSGGSGQGGSGGGNGSSTGGEGVGVGSANDGGSSTGSASAGGNGGNSGVSPTPANGINSNQTPTGTTGGAASSPSAGSNFLATGEGIPVNAGSDPNSSSPGNTNDPETGSTAVVPGPSGIGTSGTTGNGNSGGNFGGGGGGGSGGIQGSGATTSSKGGLSKGAAAGIAIAVIFVVGVAIFLVVRRQRKHRTARRRQWWFSRNGAEATYNDNMQSDTFAGPRRSVRSSFETTVDHSQTPRLELDFGVPSLPPMAQLRREPVLINLDTPITGPQVMVTNHESPITPSRFSVGSASSIASSDLGQWLIVNPHVGSATGQSSPMSVRPFSPTEAFSFPKPPTESSGSNYSSQAHSRKSTLLQDLPSLPVPGPSHNPFDDPAPAVALAPAVKIHKVPSPINVAAANPFVDPLPNLPTEPNTPSTVHPEFMEVETVKRPFIPTLSDEMLVEVGDSVRMLQMFDDGWSLVEKNPTLSTSLNASKERKPQVGLIPIDCFRNVGQGVSEFIASKRVSSYSQTSTPAGLY